MGRWGAGWGAGGGGSGAGGGGGGASPGRGVCFTEVPFLIQVAARPSPVQAQVTPAPVTPAPVPARARRKATAMTGPPVWTCSICHKPFRNHGKTDHMRLVHNVQDVHKRGRPTGSKTKPKKPVQRPAKAQGECLGEMISLRGEVSCKHVRG